MKSKDLAYNLAKIPTSIKGYGFGARTAVRFKPKNKVRNGWTCLDFSVIHVAACICIGEHGWRLPKVYPEIQDESGQKLLRSLHENLGVNMGNVCVSVLGEWKIILRRNGTKAGLQSRDTC